MHGCGSFPDRQFRRAEQVDMRRARDRIRRRCCLAGHRFPRKTEVLLGAGAVPAYSAGPDRQPDIIGPPG
jgi:hypothetical protein